MIKLIFSLCLLLPLIISAQSDSIRKVVEEMPTFPCPDCEVYEDCTYEERKPCAESAMMHQIYDNMNYPADLWDSGKSVMGVVSFIVHSDGQLEFKEVVRDGGRQDVREECLMLFEIMKEAGRWMPGRQYGEVVPVQFNLPIKFSHQNWREDGTYDHEHWQRNRN